MQKLDFGFVVRLQLIGIFLVQVLSRSLEGPLHLFFHHQQPNHNCCFRTGEMINLEALNNSGSIAGFYWRISNGMLASRSYEPFSSFKFSKPGQYQISLWLMGTNGQWYQANRSPQMVGVIP